MKIQTKVLAWTVALGAIGYIGWKYYQYTKEEKKKDEEAITYYDVMLERQVKNIEKDIEKHKAKISGDGKNAENPDDEFEEDEDGHIWIPDEEGNLMREVSHEERLYGVDYDTVTEEIVENVEFLGEMHSIVVRKRSKPRLFNYREDRSITDVIESVIDMVAQIRSQKQLGFDYDKLIYERDSMEAMDYYIALLFDRVGIIDNDLRKDLIVLATYEFTPNVMDISNQNVAKTLMERRIDHFGPVSPNAHWVSVAEVMLYYAEQLDFHVNKNTEESIRFMIDNMGFERDDHDVVINDTIVAYFGHGRVNRPNALDGFGLFNLDAEIYNETQHLHHEFNKYLELCLHLLDSNYVEDIAAPEDPDIIEVEEDD